MKSATFEGVGVDADDGTPVMAFSVEMGDGPDFDGKLHYRIAAVKHGGGEAVALIQPSGGYLATLEWGDDLRRFLERVVERRGYLSVTDYENIGWEEADGYALPIFPTLDGAYSERVNLSDRDVRAIQAIIDHFEGKP